MADLHLHGDTWIYVGNGYGFWVPPHRAGVPAEVGLITLRTT